MSMLFGCTVYPSARVHICKSSLAVRDDAAESHAFERAKRVVRSEGTNCEAQDLRQEIGWQLSVAADGECPAALHIDPASMARGARGGGRKSSLAFLWLAGRVPITADYGTWNGNVDPGCSPNLRLGRF